NDLYYLYVFIDECRYATLHFFCRCRAVDNPRIFVGCASSQDQAQGVFYLERPSFWIRTYRRGEIRFFEHVVDKNEQPSNKEEHHEPLHLTVLLKIFAN